MGQRDNFPHCISITGTYCEYPWACCLKMPFSVVLRMYFPPFPVGKPSNYSKFLGKSSLVFQNYYNEITVSVFNLTIFCSSIKSSNLEKKSNLHKF